jgi:hypothetical protein
MNVLWGSDEFRFLLTLCRAAFTGDAADEPSRDLDWSLLVRISKFHRVQGLAWNALKTSSIEAEALAADAQSIVTTNLQIAAESRALRSSFDHAGIDLLFVKGLTLGALAYRNPMLKMGWDIDVLIDASKLADAASVLQRRGYRLIEPDASKDLETWHRRRKESVWRRGELYVELHTRLADNPTLIPMIDIRSPHREVEVTSGIALPTLAADELFAYLCVHGASSAWFRLKWITDFAALIHARSPGEIEQLYQRSQELGACRTADQALLLADALFGSLNGTDLKPRLLRDRSSHLLRNAALRQVVSSKEPTGAPLGTWRIHWTQLLIKPELAFKASEVFRQVRDAVV